jgi:hypothetical protein
MFDAAATGGMPTGVIIVESSRKLVHQLCKPACGLDKQFDQHTD